jgi:hypothetical protein
MRAVGRQRSDECLRRTIPGAPTLSDMADSQSPKDSPSTLAGRSDGHEACGHTGMSDANISRVKDRLLAQGVREVAWERANHPSNAR